MWSLMPASNRDYKVKVTLEKKKVRDHGKNAIKNFNFRPLS